ncbi:MAG: 6-phosphogluconolactonase [Oscillospiraceae bacterium]|nr:6-phosphogluconolactonase [Oscillospiraceae bacterium]
MPILEKTIGTLPVYVFEDRKEMGIAAGKRAAEIIREAIAKKGEANVIFAAAPSQSDLLDALLKEDVDWTKVRGFHQDEYIGLAADHPAGFGNFMRRYIFDKRPFMELHYLRCEPDKAEEKAEEYSALLRKYPPDLIFLGVGENGHLAFNDPQVADFEDPRQVKTVELDLVCRKQQVNDGCFGSLDEVPTHALTLTMSQILSVPKAIAVVPTALKSDAIKRALSEEISTECPASVLRRYKGAELYLDRASAQKVFDL